MLAELESFTTVLFCHRVLHLQDYKLAISLFESY